MDLERKRLARKAEYARDREKAIALANAWSRAHPEKRADYQRTYRSKHISEINAKRRAKYNPEKARLYRLSRLEARLASQRKYREGHREKLAEYGKTYIKRPDVYARSRARASAWYKSHREVGRASQARRKARKLAASGHYTASQWIELRDAANGRCSYCGKVRKLTADHRIPLCRGGSNDISNIIPACQSCNSRKRHRTEAEFRALVA